MNKKEIKAEYKLQRPDMGVYTCTFPDGKVYAGWAENLKGMVNGTKMRLEAGLHVNKQMQEDFKRAGQVEIAVAELLEYDKDESKTDYTGDLRVLLEMWLERNPGSVRVK